MKAFILVLLVLIIGGYIYANRSTLLPVAAPLTGNISPSPSNTGPASNASTTVAFTSSGFTPSTITVSPGTRVTWVNQSGSAATVNSDDHPTHLKFPFLNLGQFPSGGTLSVVFPTTAGTYTYHDHYSPNFKGTVIVK